MNALTLIAVEDSGFPECFQGFKKFLKDFTKLARKQQY